MPHRKDSIPTEPPGRTVEELIAEAKVLRARGNLILATMREEDALREAARLDLEQRRERLKQSPVN